MKITVTINGREVSAAAGREAARIARAKAEAFGDDMVDRANSKMGKLYDLSRPDSRRRYPGSMRASSALKPDITGDALPITVVYGVSGGDNVLGRLIFMNFGTGGHEIVPSGAWGGRGSTPIPPRGFTRRVPPRLAWFEGGEWHFQPRVDHPGQDGTGFLEAARDEAVANMGN